MMIKSLALLTSAALLAGCVAHAAPAPTTSGMSHSHMDERACIAPGTWYDPAQKATVPMDRLLGRLQDKDVVLLGETHVIADHHRWQLQMIAQLHAQRPDMILGFEAFPRRVQDILDKWVAGKLSEDEFLKQSDWDTVWKYDAAFYMPLFHFARINRVPMVALNVDRTLIREVSEKGWKAVPEDKRRGIGNPAPATSGYLDMLSDVYTRHGDDDRKKPTLDDPAFTSFVDVQLTWDRAMAEAAVGALKKGRDAGRDPRMVAIIGRGHMDHFYGVPVQLKDLGERDVAVLSPWDHLQKCSNLVSSDGTPVAHAVFGIENNIETEKAANKPMLGVMIEGSDKGIRVGDVIQGSIAEAAGVKKNDLIIRAAGSKITKTGELVNIIKRMSPGTWLPLNIEREGKSVDLIARFPVANDHDDKGETK